MCDEGVCGGCVSEGDGMACVSDPLFGTANSSKVQHDKQAFILALSSPLGSVCLQFL